VDWANPKDLWWLIGVLVVIFTALWRLAIRTNQSKERLEQVSENRASIKALKDEMSGIKEDIAEIKDSQDKQSSDTAAILSGIQSIMNALADGECNILPARDKFNDYLAKR